MIELRPEYLSVRCILLYVIIMSCTSFKVNQYSIVCLHFKEILAPSRHHILSLNERNEIRTHNHLVRKRKLNHVSQTGQMIELCSEYLFVRWIWLYVIVMSRKHFRVNPYSIVCLNVKELPSWSKSHIWSWSDSNEIPSHNQLVRKRTLKHLTKLAKWSSCVVSTCLCGAFDCMLLSYHVRGSEWIHTL